MLQNNAILCSNSHGSKWQIKLRPIVNRSENLFQKEDKLPQTLVIISLGLIINCNLIIAKYFLFEIFSN